MRRLENPDYTINVFFIFKYAGEPLKPGAILFYKKIDFDNVKFRSWYCFVRKNNLSCLSFNSVNVSCHGFDFRISYFIRPSKTETIVYLHGLGSTKYDFFEAVNQPGLSDFTIVAIDSPGYGNSNYPENLGLEIGDLVEITHKDLSSLNSSDLTLIGHSIGGLTALLFCERYPSLVKRFINVEGNVAPEDCGVFSRKTAELSLEEFIEKDFMGKLHDEFSQLPYLGSRIFADKFRREVNPKAFHYCISIVKLSDNGNLVSIYKRLTAPKLFIYGEANNNLSYLADLTK